MADFDEGAHPRDEKGRFSSDGGGPSAKDWAKAGGGSSGRAGGGNGLTVKEWASGKRAEAPPGKMSSEDWKKMKDTVEGLKKTIDAGKLTPGVSLGQHVAIAKDMRDKHGAEFAQTKADIKALSPADASVKETESILGKLDRKPKYGTAEGLQDTTGLRVVTKDLKGIESTVAAIKDKFKVVAEDNYVHTPNKTDGAYRSHHLIIETPSGLQKEIQVRTEAMNRHAEWSHAVYKPKTDEEKAFLEKHADAISAYSRGVSDHFHALATGRGGTKMPTPPAGLKEVFGVVSEK
jgi:ppGpp synthetase/RelA/SpoT-type nucleotidyltranferase